MESNRYRRADRGRATLTTLAVAAMFAAACFAGTGKSMAQSAGRVTATSEYGNGSATGAVRRTRFGTFEVQLPTGRWEDCEGNCSEALRKQYLDFWQARERDMPDGQRDN